MAVGVNIDKTNIREVLIGCMSIIDKIHDMIEDLEDELEALRSAPINEETARKIKEIEAELHTYKFGRNPWKGLVKENPTRF